MKSEAKAWDHIEQPLRRFICHVLEPHVSSGAEWRRLLRESFHQPPSAKSVHDLELGHALHVLAHHCKGYRDEPVRLFGHEVSRMRHDGYVRYATTLRNKYAHENYVPAREQLADLVIIARLVGQLEGFSKPREPDDAHLKTAIESLIRDYTVRMTEVEGITIPLEEPPELHPSLAEALSGIRDSIESLRRAVEPGVLNARTPSMASAIPVHTGRIEAGIGAVVSDLERLSSTMSAIQAAVAALATNHSETIAAINGVSKAFEGLRSKAPAEETVERPLETGLEPDSPRPRTRRNRGTAAPPPRYAESEIRDQLIGLRWQIWRELGVGVSADGLLRRSMIEALIRERITSEDDFFARIPSPEISKTSPAQMRYLPDVLAIMSRIK